MKSYKEEVTEQAIQGLIQGGMNPDTAGMFRYLLMQMYECGYREAKREELDNIREWKEHYAQPV